MSGLDKMKTRILEEAKSSADEILAAARAQADALLEKAKADAEEEAGKIGRQAEHDSAVYVQRAESSADMRRKQAMLAAKQQVITEVLDEAYDAVLNLDGSVYFSLMEKLLEKYVLPEDGVICFSQKDLARMPDDFRGKAEKIAAQKGGSLKFSDEPGRMEGGFLLIYGGIEENCTVRAVFDSMREELSDRVNSLLFG